MNKVYLFLLSLLVSIGASARLVYFDNNYGSKGLSTPISCHTYNKASGTVSIDWNSDDQHMTDLGSNGYVFKVNENSSPDAVYFHNGSTERGSFDLTDGMSYCGDGTGGHIKTVWVLHGQVSGTETWENIAQFTYNNDNTYSTGEIELTKNYSQVCAKCFMYGDNFESDGNKRGNLRFGSDITGAGTFAGKNDNEFHAMNLSGGKYQFTLDFNNLPSTINLKVENNGSVVPTSFPNPIYLGLNNGIDHWKFNYTGTYNSTYNETTFDAEIYANPSYFTFTSETGDATSFDNNKSIMWGPSTKDQVISVGEAPTISKTENCFKFTGDPGKYTITVNHETGAVTIAWEGYIQIPSGYYFYGDMNRWSCTSNAGMTIEQKFIDADPASIWGDDADNQKFLSEDEIKEYWQFYSCEKSELPEALKSTNGTWYILDFKNLADDMGHIGRLCGQFKITKGITSQAVSEDDNQWGMDGVGVNATYIINCAVSVNSLYDVKKGKGLGNLHLNSSYVDNAVLYFNPTTTQIYITGDPVNIYAYYSIAGETDFSAPATTQFADLSQRLYYVNTPSWNDTGDSSYNPDGIYNWEKVTDTDVLANAGINTEVYSVAWRKLLPLGAAHRFPVEFNATVSCRNGSMFPAQRVRCADIFFFEADPVNVYFRYEDDHLPAWVRTNAYLETYQAGTGIVTGYTYFASGSSDASKWLATELVSAAAPGETQSHNWFKTITPISGNYISGSYALFQTAEPLSYPYGGLYAQGFNKTETKINGDDLWYVVPCGHDRDHNIEILYSHLKGTYQLRTDHADHDFQINAELFINDELDTTFHGDVTYSFEVFKTQDDGSLETMCSRTFDEGVETHGDNSKYAPYFNISAEDISNNYGAGWYQIKVVVKKGSNTYTAYDVYPVFPAE